MKNEIKEILVNSETPIDDIENLCKERISKAVNKVIFFCISGMVLGSVVYHLIIK